VVHLELHTRDLTEVRAFFAQLREGPAGWRGVVTTPASGDLALWQPKARSHR